MRDRTICQITSDSSFPKQRLLIYSIWHQNGITRRKYIYIYIVLSKYFFRWSIYFRSPFSSFAFICHSTPPFFFSRLSCRHLHLYRDCYPSSFFFFFRRKPRKLHIHYFSKRGKFRWFENGISNERTKAAIERNFFLLSPNVIFASRARQNGSYLLKFLSKNFKLSSRIDHNSLIFV